jgi:hypothetical protein
VIRGVLLDENMPKKWRGALVRRAVGVRVWRCGDAGAPPLESSDMLLLEWCENQECILLTNNRIAMPGHLADNVRQGKHVPGVFLVSPKLSVAKLAETLRLIIGASFENEYQDQINFLPHL